MERQNNILFLKKYFYLYCLYMFIDATNIINPNPVLFSWTFIVQSRKNYLMDLGEICYLRLMLISTIILYFQFMRLCKALLGLRIRGYAKFPRVV